MSLRRVAACHFVGLIVGIGAAGDDQPVAGFAIEFETAVEVVSAVDRLVVIDGQVGAMQGFGADGPLPGPGEFASFPALFEIAHPLLARALERGRFVIQAGARRGKFRFEIRELALLLLAGQSELLTPGRWARGPA